MAPAPQYPHGHGMMQGLSQQWPMEGAPTYPPNVPPPNLQGGYFYEDQISKPPPPYMFPHQPNPSPAPSMLSQGPHPQNMPSYQAPPQPSWNLSQTGSNVHIMQPSPNMGGNQWAGMSRGHVTPRPVHRDPPQYTDLHMMAVPQTQPQTQATPLNVGGTGGLSQQYVIPPPPQSTHFVSSIL